jgi:hypothetical protein
MFKVSNVPEPDNPVDASLAKAEIRSVLIVPGPELRTFAVTFQVVAVRPAVETGGAWKLMIAESKVKSPSNPTRLSDELMVDAVMG